MPLKYNRFKSFRSIVLALLLRELRFRTSRLGPNRPYLERHAGQPRALCIHRRLYPQTRQTPPNQTRRKIQEWLDPREGIRVAHHQPLWVVGRVVGRDLLCVEAHPRQGLEGVVGEDVDAAVVGLEVVDLLAEEEGPEVFAEEFDRVEGGGGAGGGAGYTVVLCVSSS